MKRNFGLIIWFVWLGIGVAQGQKFVPKPLREVHGELPPTFWEQHGWQVVIAAALFFAVIGLVIFWLCRPRIIVVEPPGTVARRDLESWRGRVEDGALVADVSRVIRRYVKTAFGWPQDELTTSEFRAALQTHPQIPAELATATGDFLRRCDEWKFAPTPSAPQSGTVDAALDLVEKMEIKRAENIVQEQAAQERIRA